jgi:hypothetical protein
VILGVVIAAAVSFAVGAALFGFGRAEREPEEFLSPAASSSGRLSTAGTAEA